MSKVPGILALARSTPEPAPPPARITTTPRPRCHRCGGRVLREADGTAFCPQCGSLDRPMPCNAGVPRDARGYTRTPEHGIANTMHRPLWGAER